MKVKEVYNWGLYPKVTAEVEESIRLQKIKDFIDNSKDVIARGNGRCYGDASLNQSIVSMKSWNHFISFDKERGILHCESGVLLSEILEMSVPNGYFLPVTPGTKFITVGGAIASDVHGKNHHKVGCFTNFVSEFTLLDNQKEIKRCSRSENSELFWATIGGMGLTGIILSAKIELIPIETAYIRNESIQCENLDEVFQEIDKAEDWTYTVAWIDCFQKGKNLGRGIMMRGEHAKIEELPQKKQNNPLQLGKKSTLRIPFYFPNFMLNRLSMQVFNFLFYRKQMHKKISNIVHYDPFFYPLDALQDWNKIYGQSGFIQYQFVIPKEKGKEGMRKILETIAHSGNGSFLVVLKLFGKPQPLAYNSFPKEGYTLALDFKINEKLSELVHALDDIVEAYGGRIYRTKDAMSRASLTNYLQNVENGTFNSTQNKRIQKDVEN